MSPNAVQLTPSHETKYFATFCVLLFTMSATRAFIVQLCGKFSLTYSPTIQTKGVRTFFDEHYSLWASLPYSFGSECNNRPIAYHIFASEAVA